MLVDLLLITRKSTACTPHICHITMQHELRDLLTPAACYSPQSIIAFLRYSRRVSDDKLDTLDTHSVTCGEYLAGTLYPAWLARDTVIEYCESLAKEKLRKIADDAVPKSDESLIDRENNTIDPRPPATLDPYGNRDYGQVESGPEQEILDWTNKEKTVESIIRSSTVKLLAEKCGNFSTSPKFYMDGYSAGRFHRS